jgi:hypothetical protein
MRRSTGCRSWTASTAPPGEPQIVVCPPRPTAQQGEDPQRVAWKNINLLNAITIVKKQKYIINMKYVLRNPPLVYRHQRAGRSATASWGTALGLLTPCPTTLGFLQPCPTAAGI